jgi:RNA polymerase sigma factor (sigma-70 family)
MNENNEFKMVEKARQGDAASIAELFKQYWRAARAAAFSITGNIDLAEDAASEALYIAFKNIGELKDTGKFGPWLRTIVIRSAQRLKNSNSVKSKNDSEISFETNAASSISDIEKKELGILIRDAVSNLPDILRETISLYYFEGYKIEQIADFLDVPIGTVKRRLYDGRNALRDSAQKILRGVKPMNNKREETLKLLRDYLEKGGDSDELRNIMRQAMTLRPVPYEILQKIMLKYSPVAKKLADPEKRKKYETRVRKSMEIFGKPSQRVTDQNHPVRKAVLAIKSALPEFRERKIDTDKIAENIIQVHIGDVGSWTMPPGYDEGIPGSFISFSKGLFFEKEDGTLCTMYEPGGPKNNEDFRRNGLVSDTLYLTWLNTDTIELHSIEEFLRDLCNKVVPDMQFYFTPYSEPRIYSGLRMQFENVTVPAATGGICSAWPGLPDGVSVASVQLYLEAWACAKSGHNIELKKLGSFLEQLRKAEQEESHNNKE